MRISGVSVGKVKSIELGDNGDAIATIEIDSQVRADPERHAGDPAPEDAARRDLRRADAREQTRRRRCPRAAQLAAGAGRDVGPARRDLPHLRHPHPGRVPALDAGRGRRAARPRRRTSRRDRARSTPSPRRPIARCGCSTASGSPSPRLVRNGGEVFDALSERQGQLSGLIQNTEAVFSTTAQPQRGPEAAVHRPADLPARVAAHPARARPVRRHREPADHRPAAGGAPAEPTLVARRRSRRSCSSLLPGLRGAINAAPTGLPGAPQAARRRPAAAAHPPAPFLDERDADLQVVRRLPPRDHRLPGQRHRGDQRRATTRATASATTCARCAVQPGDARRLSAAAALQPRQPLHPAEGLQQAQAAAAGVQTRPTARPGSTRSSIQTRPRTRTSTRTPTTTSSRRRTCSTGSRSSSSWARTTRTRVPQPPCNQQAAPAVDRRRVQGIQPVPAR